MSTTRREFLIHGASLAATLSALGGLAPGRAARKGERVLVVVQLTGGNDGLNTVVPLTQDAYWRLRPTLAIGREAAHRLDADWGLHPAMGALADVFARGELAIVQSVGHGLVERSHFRSMELWHTASEAQPVPDVGWLGRMADHLGAADPGAETALHVGTGLLPLALRGERRLAPTLRDPRGLRLAPDGADFARRRAALLEAGEADGDLDFLRRSAANTYEAAARMAELAESEPRVKYPDTKLARELALVARLVTGRFGTRVFQLELDGFDHHSRQAPAHEALLAELSGALAAFQADLRASGDAECVATLVFSEFGRRAAENGSRGTDHGAGAPVFVMGGRVAGGLLGRAPDLERLADGDVAVATDFREVYAALERDWIGSPPSSTARPLPLFS